MSYIRASKVVIYQDGVKLAACTDASLSIDRDMVERAGESQGSASEYVAGKLSWTISAKYLIPDGSLVSGVCAKLRNGASVSVKFIIDGALLTASSSHLQGNGFVTSVKTSFDVKGNASLSLKIAGTGSLS